MKTTLGSFFNEVSLRYIQKTLHASRQEIINTIRHAQVSADAIAAYLQRRKPERENIQSR